MTNFNNYKYHIIVLNLKTEVFFLFKFDTHVHTAETSPCAQVLSTDVVKLYKNIGYSGICITDHYSTKFLTHFENRTWEETMTCFLEGYRNAKTAGFKIGLDVLLGAEIQFTNSPNEYLLFGLTESLLYNYEKLHTYNIDNFKEWAIDHQILIFQAHPFRPNLTRQSPIYLDGVEVINGNPRHNSNNELSFNFAKENHLHMSAGSDFHNLEDIGKSGIITKSRIASLNQLKDNLLNDSIELISLKQ